VQRSYHTHTYLALPDLSEVDRASRIWGRAFVWVDGIDGVIGTVVSLRVPGRYIGTASVDVGLGAELHTPLPTFLLMDFPGDVLAYGKIGSRSAAAIWFVDLSGHALRMVARPTSMHIRTSMRATAQPDLTDAGDVD